MSAALEAKYGFGDRVIYILKGAEFIGVVTYSFLNGKNVFCYHIRDDGGEYWHRDEKELRSAS